MEQTLRALDRYHSGTSWGSWSFIGLRHTACSSDTVTAGPSTASSVARRLRGRGQGMEADMVPHEHRLPLSSMKGSERCSVRGVQTTVTHSVARFWAHGVRHLTALAKRDHRCPDTAVQGAIMHACLDLLLLSPGIFRLLQRYATTVHRHRCFSPGYGAFRHLVLNYM